MRHALVALAALAVLAVPAAHGQLSIEMEKPVFGYCERLTYTITVPEVTGEPAIIHIRDSLGKSGSAIPIQIGSTETLVPAPGAFEKSPYAEGTYNVDVQYGGEQATASFEVADLGIVCLPNATRDIVLIWTQGVISDGFIADALQKSVEEIKIPFEIRESNIYDIDMPGWVLEVGKLWAAGDISDADLIAVINYVAAKELLIPHTPDAGA